MGKRRTRKELQAFANKLNETLPRSEVWFWDKWRSCAMAMPQDKPNTPKFGFIPDVYNRQHRYIIEIDGSYHDQEYVQYRDKRKDALFRSGGYLVVRVKAYCDKSFSECVDLIRDRRLKVNVRRDKESKKIRQAADKAKETRRQEVKSLERAARASGKGRGRIERIRALSRERSKNPTEADIRAMHKRVAKKKEKEERLRRSIEVSKGKGPRFKFGQ